MKNDTRFRYSLLVSHYVGFFIAICAIQSDCAFVYHVLSRSDTHGHSERSEESITNE